MNIERLRALVRANPIPDVAASSGVSIRTLFRFQAGTANLTLGNLERLQAWAKGRRLPASQEG